MWDFGRTVHFEKDRAEKALKCPSNDSNQVMVQSHRGPRQLSGRHPHSHQPQILNKSSGVTYAEANLEHTPIIQRPTSKPPVRSIILQCFDLPPYVLQ